MIDLRTLTIAELPDFMRASDSWFHEAANEPHMDHDVSILDADRCVWAWEDGQPVGTSGAFSLRMTMPGGKVAPVAGVTLVGVSPTHRRRGIMTAMMQRMFADAREHGEAIAALWASEAAIYWSSGYGIATTELIIDADSSVTLLGETAGEVRVHRIDTATCFPRTSAVHDRLRDVTPGMFERDQDWFEAFRARDPGEPKGDRGPLYCVVVEIDGRDEAYALYRMEQRWPDNIPDGIVWVREAMALTPDAARELWRFLTSIDLTTRVNVSEPGLPVGTPLEWMVTEPRRLRPKLHDGMLLRLIDVAAGLAARGYEDDRALVFELTDRACPENSGRWHLEGGVAERYLAPRRARALVERSGRGVHGRRAAVGARGSRAHQ